MLLLLFPIAQELAASFTQQSLRLYSPNYFNFYRTSFLCHLYQRSMTPFVNYWKTVSSQTPCMPYPWVGTDVLQPPEAECLAPSQISRHSPARRQALWEQRERGTSRQARFLLSFPLGCDDQPENILQRWLRPGLFQMTSKGRRCHCNVEQVARCTQESGSIPKCDSDA